MSKYFERFFSPVSHTIILDKRSITRAHTPDPILQPGPAQFQRTVYRPPINRTISKNIEIPRKETLSDSSVTQRVRNPRNWMRQRERDEWNAAYQRTDDGGEGEEKEMSRALADPSVSWSPD